MSPINSDLSGLPQGDKAEGRPPVAEPVIVQRLAWTWYERFLADDDHTPSARWWASLSGRCARSVGYDISLVDAKREMAACPTDEDDLFAKAAERLEGAQPSDPPTIADAWRWGLGQMVHSALQEVLPLAFPDAGIEIRVEIEDFGSAHADALITEPDGFKTWLELKTMNGFGFKLAATSFKGNPEGPRSGAVTQGAVGALAAEADRLIIGILSLECLSPDVAARNHLDETGRFAAEWHYSRDEYEPIARQEMKRARKIITLVDEGTLPPRHVPGEMPAGARITRPEKSAWTLVDPESGAILSAGEAWNGQFCNYCQWRSRCIGDGPS